MIPSTTSTLPSTSTSTSTNSARRARGCPFAASPSAPPRRVVDLERARHRFGPLVDRVAALYRVGDPGWSRADHDASVEPPAWLDEARCARAGQTLRRYGALTGLVLRNLSLPLSYRAPVGVKPLVATGRLIDQAGPRLYRTAEFVIESFQPGAMDCGGSHWRAAGKIRTIHQRVRMSLHARGWDPDELGAPLPQPDLAATALLFGPITVEGLRRLGASITRAEADDIAHFARALAHGQGVLPELQADTHEEALELFAVVTALNGPTSEDGRRLMRALLEVPNLLGKTLLGRGVAPLVALFHRSVAAHLLGDKARELGISTPAWAGLALRPIARGPLTRRWLTPAHDAAIAWVLRRGRASTRANDDVRTNMLTLKRARHARRRPHEICRRAPRSTALGSRSAWLSLAPPRCR